MHWRTSTREVDLLGLFLSPDFFKEKKWLCPAPGRGCAPDAPLTVGDVRTTASQFLFYGE